MSESTLPEGVEIVHVAEAGDGVECRTVPGFSRYAVGTDGSIWCNLPYPGNKRYDGMPPWRRLVARRIKSGYYMTTLSKDGKTKPEYIHRIVLMAFVGPPSPGDCAAHGDGDRSNNRLDNLRWATRRENEHDKKLHGTFSNRKKRSLSDEQARLLHSLYCTTDMTYDQLSRMFRVSLAQIWHILRGKTYRHLGLDLSIVPEKKYFTGTRPSTEEKARKQA